ncbi:copper resistance protein NlpE N-terminal domain-containing protein [Ornithobacterium rhinotracheale]|uniref:copper resistance protein NlpE N-terminal domain-containing protein n=2 Tax=Ornithobacterium rhinotracheale TaxID=28251 RepID=UPI003FA4AB97
MALAYSLILRESVIIYESMKNFMIICLMGFFLLASSCKTSHKKEVIVTKSGEIVISPSDNSFNLNPNNFFGTYIGRTPCGDCKEGVKSILTLKKDSSYRLKKDSEHKSKITNGFYDMQGNIITLDDDLKFRINENQLLYIDPKNNSTFILNRIK